MHLKLLNARRDETGWLMQALAVACAEKEDGGREIGGYGKLLSASMSLRGPEEEIYGVFSCSI